MKWRWQTRAGGRAEWMRRRRIREEKEREEAASRQTPESSGGGGNQGSSCFGKQGLGHNFSTFSGAANAGSRKKEGGKERPLGGKIRIIRGGKRDCGFVRR